MRLILVCLGVIGSVSQALAAPVSYRCVDGTAFRAIFSAPGPAGSVQLIFTKQKGSVMLPQALSADGGRYATGDMEFWIKGKTARLTRAGTATDCRTR